MPDGSSTSPGSAGRSAVRCMIASLAWIWIFSRRPRTNGLPIRKNSSRPNTGVTTISSNQAREDDGRRFRGMVPSATILITSSIR